LRPPTIFLYDPASIDAQLAAGPLRDYYASQEIQMQIKIDNTDAQNIAQALFNLMMPLLPDLVAKVICGSVVADRLSSTVASKIQDDDLLCQEQVATMIEMSESWLEKKRCTGGGIPFRKIGGSVRYMRKDVADYLKSHTFKNTCEATIVQLNNLNI
jgi:hypothetical protein